MLILFFGSPLFGLLDYSIKDILVSGDEESEQYETFLHQAAELLNKDRYTI